MLKLMTGEWVYDRRSLMDFLSMVVFHAPDRFPREDYLADDQQLDLDKAFAELRNGLRFAATEPVQLAAARRLTDQAHEAFSHGRRPDGSRAIRKLEGCLKSAH